MNSNKINLQRIELLIRGELPQGRHEELFILSYRGGISNNMFMEVLLQVSDIFEELDKNEINYFLIGYSLGQKTYIETEESELENSINYKNKPIH